MLIRLKLILMTVGTAFIVFNSLLYGQGLIIDHKVVEQFDMIPAEWINTAKNNIKLYYQHTSHGSQPIKGAERIETHLYKIARAEESLPHVSGALNIYEDEHPRECSYWTAATPNIPGLNNNPEINVSMWSWCCELNRNSKVTRYFSGMEANEAAYPNVSFIYMTGNAQSWHGHHTYKSDSEGYNRYLRNEEIRQYCREHNKILFDFADIDCWYNGEKATSTYNGHVFPREHDHYNIDEGGHTSFKNCENKAKAFWYMMARLAGWDGQMATPVELMKFEGYIVKDGVELIWQTASESNNYGFEVQRSQNNRAKFQTIGFVNGNGTTGINKQYCYVDQDVTNSTYYYRLKQIDNNGNFRILDTIQITICLPSKFCLYQNYPNPFNASTTILYSLLKSGQVNLTIYDLSGKEVCKLVDELQGSGNYKITWNLGKICSGEYFYKLKVDDFSETKSMIILK